MREGIAITLGDLAALAEIPREIINGGWANEDGDAPMPGKQHAKIGARLIRAIGDYVAREGLGEVYQDGLSFVLELGEGDTVKRTVIPDVAFVQTSRVSDEPDAYYVQAPDLAIEIISPSERAGDIQDKLDAYLRAGTRQVWLVYPQKQHIVVYAANTAIIYRLDDTIPGGDVLPGFSLAVKTVFDLP